MTREPKHTLSYSCYFLVLMPTAYAGNDDSEEKENIGQLIIFLSVLPYSSVS